MKKAIIVHGWGGHSDKGWLVWINQELKKRGFEVYSPEMPDKDYPEIEKWVNYLKQLVKSPDEETFFIGHSIGCQAILRYIETLPENVKLGGVFFVAGWLNLKNLETEEEKKIAEPWVNAPINFSKIKNKSDFFVLFSDNDPWVPVEDSKIFKTKLDAEVIIEKNKGHYIESETKEIPILLNKILEKTK